MKEIAKLVFVLTLISLASGLLLAFTNKVTATPIEQARTAERVRALAEVLPEFDNDPVAATSVVVEAGAVWVFHRATKQDAPAGIAFESSSKKGYGGAIRLIVGLNADDTVREVRILQQQETPGLGSKIAAPSFLRQFSGRPAEGAAWKVRKDGGDLDAITGATISSRAVAEAVADGLAVYLRNKAAIVGPGR